MSQPAPYELAYPLRLRWTKRQDERGQTTWRAFDGPWTIGYVADLSGTFPAGTRTFTWQIQMLSSRQFRGSIQGREWTSREAAENLEETFFRLLPEAHSFEGSLEDAIAYAEWLGVPIPVATDWMRRRHILGENPLPVAPLRGALTVWGEEERRRGRTGSLSPSLMTQTYGAEWRAKLC
ncbi:hypothetical protein ACLNGM_09990 [Aureimonas phyllosphaerae]|uniref:hypothetical protein n=1 Tax=Aureimonas phyllosphaerae TaxID=1166078 RepID=UPI003A5C5378